MEGDELGGDLVRLDNGFLVDEETYTVVNSDDVLGKHLFFSYRSICPFKTERRKYPIPIPNS